MTTDLSGSKKTFSLLEDIDRMYDLLQREAEDGERLHRPTPAVQKALKDSGVFQLMVPAELGGYEAGAMQIIEVIEKLSHADASIGWLVRVLASETAYAVTYLSQEAVTELFADGKQPLIAGQSTVPSGRAVKEHGGYRVSGTWQYAPGLSMATHVDLGVTVEGTGETRVCLVPRSELRISDNWDMLGLRATASLDYTADELFVDEKFVFHPGLENARRGGIINRLSPALIAGLLQGVWSQGVGRRMLDELRVLTRRKVISGGTPVTSDEFFAEFARHYSHVRGTMALLREIWTENERVLHAHGRLDNEQETMTRLAASLATRTVLEISQLVHRFAGAQVMRNGTLQRFFRDGHAGTQHRGTSHLVTQQCGRMLSGTLPEGSHWGFFDLVVPD